MCEELYSRATGELGWSDDEALNTPISRLELAVNGRSKLIVNILQAVFGKSKEQIAAEEAENQPADPAAAAAKLMDILTRRQAHDSRHKRKPPNK